MSPRRKDGRCLVLRRASVGSVGVALETVALLLILTVGMASAGVASADDPLARPEFDKEVSVDMRDASVVAVFRLLSQVTSVPFVLDFDADPGLKLTFKAENMVCRGILASLAAAHDLEFFSTDEGVVVRRRGLPPAAKRVTVGAWPAKPGPRYRLEFLVRDSDGRVLYQPRISTQMGVVGQLKLGLNGREVTVLDRSRGIAEPRYVGGIELAICIKRDSGIGLDLLLEVVNTQPRDEGSYTEDHSVARRTVAPGQTSLFKTADGHEIVLSAWSRISDGTNAKP